MVEYSQAAVIQAGPHAICVTEPCFKEGLSQYTMCFFIRENAKSLGGCQSLAFTTAFRGIALNPDIGRYILRINRDFNFDHFPRDREFNLDEFEILKVYQDQTESKVMTIFKTCQGMYGGFIKAKSDFEILDNNEVLANIHQDNAFLAPKELAILFAQDQYSPLSVK